MPFAALDGPHFAFLAATDADAGTLRLEPLPRRGRDQGDPVGACLRDARRWTWRCGNRNLRRRPGARRSVASATPPRETTSNRGPVSPRPDLVPHGERRFTLDAAAVQVGPVAAAEIDEPPARSGLAQLGVPRRNDPGIVAGERDRGGRIAPELHDGVVQLEGATGRHQLELEVRHCGDGEALRRAGRVALLGVRRACAGRRRAGLRPSGDPHRRAAPRVPRGSPDGARRGRADRPPSAGPSTRDAPESGAALDGCGARRLTRRLTYTPAPAVARANRLSSGARGQPRSCGRRSRPGPRRGREEGAGGRLDRGRRRQRPGLDRVVPRFPPLSWGPRLLHVAPRHHALVPRRGHRDGGDHRPRFGGCSPSCTTAGPSRRSRSPLSSCWSPSQSGVISTWTGRAPTACGPGSRGARAGTTPTGSAIVDPMFWLIPLVGLAWGAERHWRDLVPFVLLAGLILCADLMADTASGWLRWSCVALVALGAVGWVRQWFGVAARRQVAALSLCPVGCLRGSTGGGERPGEGRGAATRRWPASVPARAGRR